MHVTKFFLKLSLGSKKVSGEAVSRLVSSVFQSVYRTFSFSGRTYPMAINRRLTAYRLARAKSICS